MSVAVEMRVAPPAIVLRAANGRGIDRISVQAYFEELQDRICIALTHLDGVAAFQEDRWSYAGGGGGKTRILQFGGVFEKAGVNFSAIEGRLPAHIARRMRVDDEPFFASGVSLVVHPLSPMTPIVHMNVRYFEQPSGKWWFGGGIDLTPCYPFLEDVLHFHRTLRTACDKHDASYYPRFKKWCDEYFVIRHRNETRGVGGIFFDHVCGNAEEDFAFVREVGDAFLPAYLPIVERRTPLAYGERERTFQLIRRARYVEFNLIYDRGTAFGLETQGRAESILMSMPPLAQWPYGWSPEQGSREAQLMEFLAPQDWLSRDPESEQEDV